MTVGQFIEMLQRYHSLDEPIIFQYFVEGMGNIDLDNPFEDVAKYLMDNDQFGDDTADIFNAWLMEADDVLNEIAKE